MGTVRTTPSPVLVASACSAAALMVATGAVVRDFEAIAIGVGLGLGTALLWLRKGSVGRVLLVLLFADTIAWMAPAAWSNIQGASGMSGLLVPLALVVLSATGIASVAGVSDRAVAIARLVLLAASVVAAVAPAGDDAAPSAPGALAVSSRGAKFSVEDLEVNTGDVAVVFKNHDLFWHTFTIDALDVDIRAPMSATRSASFRADPGTYKFYCAIPGHESAGMKGTFTVR